jgi:hypothetical protein
VSWGLGAASLRAERDCLLLDLDGTVYRGSAPIADAVETLESLRRRTLFSTANPGPRYDLAIDSGPRPAGPLCRHRGGT